jgi:hypothetical protein
MLCHKAYPITFDAHDVRIRHIESPCGAFCNSLQRQFGIRS